MPVTADESVRYSFSAGLFDRLAGLGVTLAFSSYQSGQLTMLGSTPQAGAQLQQCAVARPMGLWSDPRGELVLATGASITRFANVLCEGERINQVFDACFMPRAIALTGDLDLHDVAVDREGRVLFVATRYNCVATLSPTHSFTPVWHPPFISALVDEDRCHLNGLALDDGRMAYATAVSRSDTIDGWRDRRHDGGVVIDIAGGTIACGGLSMPHSPRLHRGELWLLNAGTGELGVITRAGRFEPRVFCPGFARGLAFHGNLAFVGLSRPRYERFEGLALDDRLRRADAEAWCGVQVIDLIRGTCVDWFRIDGAIAEIYDVAVIAGHRCAMAVSPTANEAATLITIDRAVVEEPVPAPFQGEAA